MVKPKKIFYWSVIVFLLALLSASFMFFQSINPVLLSRQAGRIWMETDPVQCLGNPWEIDWLKSNNMDFYSYPKSSKTPELEPSEIEIIKDYYKKQKITIFDIKSKQTHEIVCRACSCPEGYTLYLLVSDSDIIKMQEFGYKISK
ncbi:MAG: hypothetical protein HYX24_01120 [Candidatus Aenigmarchaeota archaeon]|nr:hypothetical protein [Candidatus Aenigmarchaeota archaeon]